MRCLYPGTSSHKGRIMDYRKSVYTKRPADPEAAYLGSPEFPELNRVIDGIAEKYSVSNTAVVTAWILRHPAKIQMIAGTMNEKRIGEIAAATDIVLTREEWYRIYLAAGHMLP